MNGISFVVITSGKDHQSIFQVIDSIERLSISNYEIIVVGGMEKLPTKNNTIHIPFDEHSKPLPWLTRKKNLGVRISTYDIVVIMHDYYVFDPNWYIEFEKFGTDWDICVQQNFHMPEQGNIRGNGWRVNLVPGYPELPYAMTIPWDIDCLIPYMEIQGAFWVAKRDLMLQEPLDENILCGQGDDTEWNSRVVPCFMGRNPNQLGYKIVANPKCISRFNRYKDTYPGNPDWDAIERHFEPLWNFFRNGGRRPGIYHYERSLGRVVLS